MGRTLLDELLETTMNSELDTIEPVPGGPRFRILCLGDSTATLCSTKPYVEPVTVDVNGMVRLASTVSLATHFLMQI